MQSSASRARRLFRAKLMAGGAVCAAAGLFVAAPHLPLPTFWRGILGAAGEAGTVGGLADWFAVTALFRRPLGLPIPHTALIPARKDEIGRQLARFIEEHFLDPALLHDRLRETDWAAHLAQWLKTPEAATFMARNLIDVLRGLVHTGTHLSVVDAVLPFLREINDGLGHVLAEQVGKRTGKWVPYLVDRQVAEAARRIIDGIIKALGTPDSPERQALDAWIRARFAELSPELQDAAKVVIQEIRDEIQDPKRLASPELEATVARLVSDAGAAIGQSQDVRGWINNAIETGVLRYIVPWRMRIGAYIEDVVRRWDPADVTKIIELQVGHDLQYIRLNGTLIGALIGVALFLAASFLGAG